MNTCLTCTSHVPATADSTLYCSHECRCIAVASGEPQRHEKLPGYVIVDRGDRISFIPEPEPPVAAATCATRIARLEHVYGRSFTSTSAAPDR